jgi:predicted PurR-regulated permease PerM
MADYPSSHQPIGPGHRTFAARVATALLMVSLFVALVLALWKAAQVLLLFFAGVLLAVVMRTAGNALARWTGLRQSWALVLVMVLTLSATTAAIWAAAPSVTEQFQALRENLGGSVETVSEKVEGLPGGEEVVARATQARYTMFNKGDAWQRVSGIFSNTFGAIGGVFIILFAGLFFAFDPRLYLAGFLRLVPVEKRPRCCVVFRDLGRTLQGWLVGQMISMAILFVTTWVMLALLGVPLAFILALMTGIMTFIPYIGPLLALIPILLVAFVQDPMLALYAGILYMLIQNVEANVIMPLVFQRTVHLPPALSIAGQLILGAIFGILGFILATPLTAVALVLTQRLYVEDVLDDSMDREVAETPTLDGAPESSA